VTGGSTFLHTISAIFIASSVLLYFSKRFNHPSIPVYIITGMLLGGDVLNILGDTEYLLAMSMLGIIFLLFTLGLETEIDELRGLGTVILVAGLAHTLVVAVAGYLASHYLGSLGYMDIGFVESVYIGLFIAFSSTIEVISMLEKKFELETLHGRLIIGILLIEDFIAITAISGVNSINAGIASSMYQVMLALVLFTVALGASSYITPHILRMFENSRETLILTSLSACFLFMGIAYQNQLPLAVGAFTGGLSLTKFPYEIEIRNQIRSLRDFFGTVFFVSLGALFNFSTLGELIVPILVLTGVVIIVKPLMTFVLLNLYGYRQRTSFLTGMGLGQVSEFSLFILLLGRQAGIIDSQLFAVGVSVAVISIMISSYAYRHHDTLYRYFSDLLIDIQTIDFLESTQSLRNVPDDIEGHIILIGCHIQGLEILKHLKDIDKPVIIVDYDPEIIDKLLKNGETVYYGDINHIDLRDELNADRAEMIISTIPRKQPNKYCTIEADKIGIPSIARSENIDDALDLYNLGAQYVILPELLAADKASNIILDTLENDLRFDEIRETDIARLHAKENAIISSYRGSPFLRKTQETQNQRTRDG
jgi:CPA2 family monovalent cation:H+ antiporter-2